ncbi:hypothetical protein PROPEN_00002 [Proteus penneri ATCC 35198]|nr:hypothetical protein PROPEN_00002 [Proteus penneri ATCC 35198]
MFGIGVSVFAHGLVVPLLGLSSWLWTAGYQALVSEFVGTAFGSGQLKRLDKICVIV